MLTYCLIRYFLIYFVGFRLFLFRQGKFIYKELYADRHTLKIRLEENIKTAFKDNRNNQLNQSDK